MRWKDESEYPATRWQERLQARVEEDQVVQLNL
jgi:hypothetical protein